VLLEAVPAIDGPAFGRFEWNLGLSSAIRTYYIVHLAWGPIVASRATVAARTLFAIHLYSTYFILESQKPFQIIAIEPSKAL
jgi:hypothetical protein